VVPKKRAQKNISNQDRGQKIKNLPSFFLKRHTRVSIVNKKYILIACGTAVATATAVAMKMRELFEKEGINADTTQCKAIEVNYFLSQRTPDLIVSTTPIPGEKNNGPNRRTINGVTILNGVPYLTGIGKEKLDQEILNILSGKH